MSPWPNFHNAPVPSWRHHPVRVCFRSVWLGAELLLAAARYVLTCGLAGSGELPRKRALWLLASSKRVLRVINTRVAVGGPVPGSGLLASNHLSYLDILLIASLTPAAFVSKHEIRSWPVFGWFARIAGTVFVDRQKRHQTAAVASEMELALKNPVLLVLFPEGRNSNGETVLPFKSSLFEPAVRLRPPLHVACIRYELDDGNPANEVCYWGDMVLLPHMFNLLGKKEVRAFVDFEEVPNTAPDRKELTRALHARIVSLHASAGIQQDPSPESRGLE